MVKTCVVYLVREKAGLGPFLDAYQRFNAGCAHEIMLVVRVPKPVEVPELCFSHLITFSVKQRALPAFREAAESYHSDVFVFLNSWSRPLADGWLRKLVAPLERENVGAVAATASWESFRSNGDGVLNRILPEFPNPHLRTNALALRREDALRWLPRLAPMKQIEYLMESGRSSLTQKVFKERRQAVVAGRSGEWATAAGWLESGTYRSGEQEELLVADNQTDAWAAAGQPERERLRRAAWGL